MPDPRLESWAKVLVNYSVAVKPGQTVAITGGIAAEPLFRAIYREVVRAGGHPVMLPVLNGLGAILFRHGQDEQLEWITPIERFIRTEADVVINVLAESNTKTLSEVDPSRQVLHQRARSEIVKTFMQRSAEGTADWTITLYPTDAYAQDADMSTSDYAEFVQDACKLNHADPVQAWLEQAAEQQRIIDWLAGKDVVHLIGPGTDLQLSTNGRKWINADGRKNFPDGEIFTAPVETAVNGHIEFSFPAIHASREVAGIRLEFKDGQVVNARATKSEDFLLQTLDTDPGSRVVGELAIGTNFDIQRFTRNILFDEKIGGTVHLALGAGYPECGSLNQSAIHWDMISDLREGGRIEVDGELLMKDGKFVV